MRIVYVLTTLSAGGTENQVVALSRRMAARGHDVAIIALRCQTQSDVQADCEVVHLDMRRTLVTTATGLARGLRFLQRFEPDLVLSHNVHGNIVARLLRVAYPAAPVVSTIHNVYEGGWLRMLAYRLTDSLSSANVAVSEAAAERCVRIKAMPRAKSAVITNGIDVAGFAAEGRRRALTRERMGVLDGFVWLTAGRIVPAKDYPNLLHAFAKLRERENRVQLWIAGYGVAKYEEEMRSLAAKLDLNLDVHWLGMRCDMPALFDAADGFVLASRLGGNASRAG
jgi:glycosyltransferase involved in cell wall biosynthesis